MKTALLVFHIIITIVLASLILLQNSKGGLTSGIGGGYRSRRGAERIIFTGTIAVGIIFLITSLLNLVVR